MALIHDNEFFLGGLICQGVIETSDHNVDTFIALSSPLNGQFGGE